ncbi:MAG: PKD domain-containing protein, partial [Actinomycetota bacterium]|nr:PKD domain-containing protein [Actinomycetota bacterium]
QLNGAGSTDVDGDPLTYQWSLITVPSGSKAALSNPAAVNPTFTADIPGTYVAQLIANDGMLNSAPATVKITTNAILAPTANAGPNQTVGHKTTVTLSGSGTDPQSLPFTFQWTLTTKPMGSTATLAGANVATPTFFSDLPGIYIAQLIVNNGFVSSAPSTVTITTTNTPPVANAGPNQNVPAGSTVKLDGSGSKDADQDPLTYSWSFLSRPTGSGATLTAADTVSPVFTADLAGTYVLQLIVNDGFANSLSPSTVTITAAVNSAIALTPNPLNLSTAGPGTLMVTLPAVAGANGQVVNLVSGDASVASVPANVTIPSGSTGANVTVTPGAIGSTTILATASGFQPGNAAVNVIAAGITLSPNAINVGLTRTMDGTITLSGQAPASGVTVNLTSSDPATAAVTPSSISIPAGGTTASFTVAGVAVGSATITAAAPGYGSGTSAVNVGQLGKIVLPANATVGPNQSAQYAITLATPAPAGGVTIALATSDPLTATVTPANVFIDFKQITPATQPSINGVNLGSAIITASAPGFIGGTGQVQVTAALSFPSGTLNLNGTSTQNLILTLSPSAPSGGLLVNLASSNAGVATVPSSVTFPPSATSVNVPVTGVAGGSTTITATSSAPGIANATATVNVQVFGAIILPANATVGLGQSVAFPVTLPSPAPANGVTINLSSSDSSKVTITPSSVTVPFNSTVPASQPQVNGVGVGSATITASAPNSSFSSANVPVNVTAALSFSGNITITGTGTQNVTLNLSGTTSAALTVNLSSDNTGVATVPATVIIPANGNNVTVPVTGVAAGSATIMASAPPSMAGNIASTTAKVAVT